MLYLPIADKCLEVMAWAVKSEHPLEGVAAGGLMCLFIPFWSVDLAIFSLHLGFFSPST
jgi:hypothetical protein